MRVTVTVLGLPLGMVKCATAVALAMNESATLLLMTKLQVTVLLVIVNVLPVQLSVTEDGVWSRLVETAMLANVGCTPPARGPENPVAVTVKVWAWFTSLMAVGVMVTFSLTKYLMAAPL